MSLELQLNYKGEQQTLQVNDSDVVTFPDGVIGFKEWRRFVLIEDPEEAPLAVLHCIDDTKVTFLVTTPWQVYPEYRLTLPAQALSQLDLENEEDARVLCILTLRREAGNGPIPVTANLLAPIVINPRTRLARQVILQDTQYLIRHPVLVVQPTDKDPGGSEHIGFDGASARLVRQG